MIIVRTKCVLKKKKKKKMGDKVRISYNHVIFLESNLKFFY